MPDRARVTSLEALEDFRAKLILYREKAGRVLDEVSDDVIRESSGLDEVARILFGDDADRPRWLETVRGVGYRFSET